MPAQVWRCYACRAGTSRMKDMEDSAGLTCKELVELVTDYLEGTLEPWERRRFEEHLLICEGCAAYLDQMRRTIEVVGAITEESMPPHARDKLLATFRDWNRRRDPTT
jgi:predicted anti-sigma-YlaC factor YlaD